ncbi:retrovirus-related pol polyprotein from transposon TNT 1-94 [Tanacetum coccineum]
MFFIKRVENQNDIKFKQLRTDNGTEFRNSILVNFCDEKRIYFSTPYTPKQNGVAERKNRTLIEAARTMLAGSVFSKQYWIEAVATACYTQNRSTIVKRHLKTPYEIFRGTIPNIDFLYVFGCPFYIYNHKDYLGKFNEKADDGYFLGYSLVFKVFRVFNTRRQQTKETYHITFDESTNAIKLTKPSFDNIIIVESKRYPLYEYLHHYEPSQRQSHDKHIKLVNIIGDLGAEMLTRAMAKELSAASDHECIFVDFLSEEEPKKVFEALKHLGWVDAMQEELNQFIRNKVWTLVPTPYGKTIIGSKWVFRNKRDETGIVIEKQGETCFDLKGYSESDYAGCNIDRKSTLAKAEYVAAAGYYANILWMKSQLTDYDIIYEKHIDIRYQFIRDDILNGDIELHFILTQYQLDDIFTKPLDEPTFKILIVKLGLDNGVAASFQRSRIHKLHAHTQAFKVNHSTAQVDQGSQIKMIQVKEMMQDNDLKNSKSKDKGSRSRSQSMNEQSHYKQDKTKTRQSINVKSHIFNVIGSTEEFEERDLNIGGDC